MDHKNTITFMANMIVCEGDVNKLGINIFNHKKYEYFTYLHAIWH